MIGCPREYTSPTCVRLQGIGKQETLPWESIFREFNGAIGTVDINIFSQDDAHTFVQIEGMDLKPFTPARPDDDTVLFSSFEFKVDGPNGDIAAAEDGLSADDIENAINAERVSFYYLRRFVEATTPETESNTLPHFRKLLRWARNAVERVKSGKNQFIPTSCESDTEEQISALLEKYAT